MSKQVVSIGEGKDKAVLSKSQKEFNRLTQKIPALRATIQQFETVSLRLQQRSATELKPLVDTYTQHRADLVRLMDKAWDSGFFKAREKKKLEEMIVSMAFNLISEDGMDDLKPIYDKHNGVSFDEEVEESEDLATDMMKAMAEQMFGIDIDDDDDLDTPEKLEEFIRQQMAAQEEAAAEKQRQREENRAKKPKNAKKEAQEQKKAEEEQHIKKSVREVYMDLVKAFHPDREPEESEKLRKTIIMQRVTEAYENNDLLSLLQLQLEFERIDKDHLESIAEDRLKHFNKILLRQVRELEEMLYDMKAQLSMLTNRPYLIDDPLVLERQLEKDIKALKKEIKAIQKELLDLADPVVLKAFLKDYHI